jgi:hypothetical protein
MPYGPRSLSLSARRKLQPAQNESRVVSTLVEAPITSNTLQLIFDVPITTGSGTMQVGFYVSNPYYSIFLRDAVMQDEFTFYFTDSLVPIAELVWVQDAGNWRTDSNGVPFGPPIYPT